MEAVPFHIERGTGPTAQRSALSTQALRSGQTHLHLASLDGHMEVTQSLVERGTDVTVQNEDGIFHSVSGSGPVQVVQSNLRLSATQTKVGGLRGIWRRTKDMRKSRGSLSTRESRDSA